MCGSPSRLDREGPGRVGRAPLSPDRFRSGFDPEAIVRRKLRARRELEQPPTKPHEATATRAPRAVAPHDAHSGPACGGEGGRTAADDTRAADSLPRRVSPEEAARLQAAAAEEMRLLDELLDEV